MPVSHKSPLPSFVPNCRSIIFNDHSFHLVYISFFPPSQSTISFDHLNLFLFIPLLALLSPSACRQIVQSNMSLDTEVVVAIAIGIPSCLITLLSLWVAYLTFNVSRQPMTIYQVNHMYSHAKLLPSLETDEDLRPGRSQSVGYYHLKDSPPLSSHQRSTASTKLFLLDDRHRHTLYNQG